VCTILSFRRLKIKRLLVQFIPISILRSCSCIKVSTSPTVVFCKRSFFPNVKMRVVDLSWKHRAWAVSIALMRWETMATESTVGTRASRAAYCCSVQWVGKPLRIVVALQLVRMELRVSRGRARPSHFFLRGPRVCDVISAGECSTKD
jgi:hypothetical protein